MSTVWIMTLAECEKGEWFYAADVTGLHLAVKDTHCETHPDCWICGTDFRVLHIPASATVYRCGPSAHDDPFWSPPHTSEEIRRLIEGHDTEGGRDE